MENNDLWNRITDKFFRKVETPASEFFVSRVMARIDQREEASATTHWFRWLAPSFGFGFAALLFTLTLSSVRSDLSAETLLLADNDAEAQWFFSDEVTQSDDVLNYTLEELR